jgi:hypothetical protein
MPCIPPEWLVARVYRNMGTFSRVPPIRTLVDALEGREAPARFVAHVLRRMLRLIIDLCLVVIYMPQIVRAVLEPHRPDNWGASECDCDPFGSGTH